MFWKAGMFWQGGIFWQVGKFWQVGMFWAGMFWEVGIILDGMVLEIGMFWEVGMFYDGMVWQVGMFWEVGIIWEPGMFSEAAGMYREPDGDGRELGNNLRIAGIGVAESATAGFHFEKFLNYPCSFFQKNWYVLLVGRPTQPEVGTICDGMMWEARWRWKLPSFH